MRRNRRGWIYLLLVITLFGVTLGYAYLNTELQINGTTNVSSASWNVYFNNVQFGSNNVTTVTTPATISTGKTEVSFNVDFKEPGDTYEFTVDAVNDGSIDAMISTFSKGVYAANGTTEKTLPDYLEYSVTYSDGIDIANKHLLESGKTETYKVRVHYKEDITSSQLPSTDDNYMFKFSVTYAQADKSGIHKNAAKNKLVRVSNIVTSGDGLYDNGDGTYTFKGAPLNNYLSFENIIWRIYGIDSNGIKLVKNTALPDEMRFDYRGVKDTGYCASTYWFCGAWAATDNLVGKPSELVNQDIHGVVEDDSEINTYLNGDYYINQLHSNEHILDAIYNVGPENNESAFQWKGKVALLTLSEYVNSLLVSERDARTEQRYIATDKFDLMSITPGYPAYKVILMRTTVLNWSDTNASNSRPIYPVIYLSSDIELLGDGTETNPYRIDE